MGSVLDSPNTLKLGIRDASKLNVDNEARAMVAFQCILINVVPEATVNRVSAGDLNQKSRGC